MKPPAIKPNTVPSLVTALLLAGLLCACQPVTLRWPRALDLTPPPNPYARNARVRSRTSPSQDASYEPASGLRRTSTPAQSSAGTALPAPPTTLTSAGPSGSSAALVTMDDSGFANRQIETNLDQAKRRLSEIERTSLSPANLVLYDQARGLLGAAGRALAESDFSAASGFTEKAALLTARLAPKSAQP